MGARSIFALEASDAEIACSCGGSVLHTSFDGQRYRLLVPCGVCGKIHEAVCPPERIREELDIPVFDFNSMIGHVAMALSLVKLY